MPAADIRDVRPPVEFPVQINFLYISIAVMSVMFILGVFYFLKIRKKEYAAEIIIRPPREIALEQLELLLKEDLLSQEQFNLYYSKLSNIVRYYLEGEFNVKAPEMTTEEFLFFLQTSDKLSDEIKSCLKDFLISCDMVKFAKHMPSHSEAKESFDLAGKIVNPS